MALVRSTLALTVALVAGLTVVPESAAPPAAAAPAVQSGQRAAQPAPQRRSRRRSVTVMTLTTSAWPDGGVIPAKHTQAGAEVSPAFTWSGAPEGVVSYVLVARDLDAAVGDGTTDVLHWLLWNIPGPSTSLPEHVPALEELADGTRQISQTGPYYRGPGAQADGPSHHYAFELFALDTMIDVPAVGASPADTYAAVRDAMSGHVRGKAAYVGLYKR